MPKGKITLIAPPDHAKDRNVITARLEWNSICDSFDVYLDTVGRPDQMARVATANHPVYNSGRLEFSTTYYWMIKGYRGGQLVEKSAVWSFSSARRSGKRGLSKEYGMVKNGIGYFQNLDGTGVKAVDLDTYERLWEYQFEDVYDVSPLVEQKGDGTWLILEHERANGRVKALYLSDGETAWISDNNIPYIGGTGFSFYVNHAGLSVILAKGSNGLHALSVEDGKELWFSPAQSWFGTIPAVDQVNRWIYSQSFEEIKKIDAETGKVLKSAYIRPEAMTAHTNTLLVNDRHGYYIATVNWNGHVDEGNMIVYDSCLNVIWKKDRYVERLSSLSYHDGLLYSAQCGGWYDYLLKKTEHKNWKHITAFKINDGSVMWDLDLSRYNYTNMHDVIYCNGYLYAITDNTGTPEPLNRLLFRIDAADGRLVEMLDFGYPLSICASPVITNGKLFEAGVVTVLGEGEKSDWYGQYGNGQLNHFAANDSSVTRIVEMHLSVR
ncbi:MAG: PQQ-binding-like beta-propeller repeat protein [Mangrovibacterium sp.]